MNIEQIENSMELIRTRAEVREGVTVQARIRMESMRIWRKRDSSAGGQKGRHPN